MKTFAKEFWHTLTTPEEWSDGSIVAVGIACAILFGLLMGEAFDACWIG